MKKFTKMVIVFIQYLSVFCAGCFFAVGAEYSFNFDVIFGLVVCAVLFVCVRYSLKEQNELYNNEESEEE